MELKIFCNRHYILKLSLFGSIIHGTFKSTSDLDILVEFDPTHYPSLFDMVEMEEELSIIFHVPKVDLRTAHDLSHYFRSEVINEAKTIYDGRRSHPIETYP